MKKIYFFFFIIVCLNGCDENPIPPDNGIITSFELSDVNGVGKTTFKSGEDFKMIFLVTNLSGQDLYYRYSWAPVVFEIHQRDSTIATSIDGLAFIEIARRDSIKNGETFKAEWLAPNSIGRDPKIALPAGKYQAYISPVFYAQFELDKTSPIEFVVVN